MFSCIRLQTQSWLPNFWGAKAAVRHKWSVSDMKNTPRSAKNLAQDETFGPLSDAVLSYINSASGRAAVMPYFFPIKCQPLRLSAPNNSLFRSFDRAAYMEYMSCPHQYHILQLLHPLHVTDYAHRLWPTPWVPHGESSLFFCLPKKRIWGPKMSSVAEESMASCLWVGGGGRSFARRENRCSSGL